MRLQRLAWFIVVALLGAGCAADDTTGGTSGGLDADAGGIGGDVAEPGDGVGMEDAADVAEPDGGAVDVGTEDGGPDAAVDGGPDTAMDGGPEDTAPDATVPDWCCTAESPCVDTALRCVLRGGDPLGVCEPPATAPACWVDADCGADEACEGAFVCGCLDDCDAVDTPGQCVPKGPPEGCCFVDEDCDLGTDMAYVCAETHNGDPGACLPLPGAGECWTSGDCAQGEACTGASYCPCGAACGRLQKPGTCVAETGPKLCHGGCVEPDTTCVGDLGFAGGGQETALGQCMPTPDPGLCWEGTDCSEGQVCVNAVYCAAATTCLADEHPGVCLAALGPAEGCWADLDCLDPAAKAIAPLKMLCTGADVPALWANAADPLVPAPGECCAAISGQCFEDADCTKGEHCVGASLPFEGACADPLAEVTAGDCVPDNPWPDELCASDDACGAGESCIGEWACPADARCTDPSVRGLCLAAGDGCWEPAGCGGAPCVDAWICDVLGGEMCGGAMATQGECGNAQTGDLCLPGPNACGDDMACCYPCGIPGCAFTCMGVCDPNDPLCSGGCPVGIP